MSARVAVILVNWNGWRDTARCLQALGELDYADFFTVVVDNASSDGSAEELRSRFPGVTLLQSERNLGFAGGNNLGIRHALEEGFDYCWLLNNDTVPEPGALAALVARMEEDPGVGICGSRLVYEERRNTLQALGGGTYHPWLGVTRSLGEGEDAGLKVDRAAVEQQLDYVAGASMLVSRDFLETVGMMREDYFLYYEEMDWAERARGRYRLGFAPDSVVYHREGASIGGGSADPAGRSRLADYFQVRNRLRFTRRHHPAKLPAVYLTVLAALGARILRGQWGRAAMILRLMFTYMNEEPEMAGPGEDR